jgi:hypothetical protein
MRLFKHITAFTAVLALLLVSIPQITWAYLDPASVSYYLQVIAGGLVAFLMGFKFFWGSIKKFFGKLFGKKKAEGAESAKVAETAEKK